MEKSEGSDLFKVHPKSGNITLVGALDYESKNSYTLVVRAADSGVPPLVDKAKVYITVNDVNDNDPYFKGLIKQVERYESAETDFIVYNVTATDRDSNLNGIVHYRIESGNTNNTFIIEQTTGKER